MGFGKPCAGKPPARFDEGEGSVPGDRLVALSTLQQGRRQECRRSVFVSECLDQVWIGGTLAAGLSEEQGRYYFNAQGCTALGRRSD